MKRVARQVGTDTSPAARLNVRLWGTVAWEAEHLGQCHCF